MVVVGVILVHNEDVFVEQAIRNIAAFCDRIHAVDHLSTDRTAEILRNLAGELDHLEVRRSSDAGDSHRPLEAYAGTSSWAFGVDGDELYDPAALALLRAYLEAGAHADVFRLKGHVLNCAELDEPRTVAKGYLAPPSRPVTKLFNMAAVESWSGCLERLHDGEAVFREGYEWDSLRYLSEKADWDSDPLRMLHTCFLRRSSVDPTDATVVRRGLPETGAYRRGWRGLAHRLWRQRYIDPRIREYQRSGSGWKEEWYARGPLVLVEAAQFFSAGRRPARSASTPRPASAQVTAKRADASRSSRAPENW